MSGYYGTRTPGDLAFGRPTGLGPTKPFEAVELDHYLKPLDPGAQKIARTNTKPANRTLTAKRLALLAKEQPVAAPQAPAPASAPAAPTAVPADQAASGPLALAPTNNDDAQRYAVREGRSSKQAQYRGGDVVVISVSTLLIVLLIVLIIVLLT